MTNAEKKVHSAAALKAELKVLEVILSDINFAQLAEKLRPAHKILHPVIFDPDDESLRGDINVHIPIEFDDGVKWMARARQCGYHASPRHISRITMQGEIHALRWLREIALPVPGVMSEIYLKGGTDFYFLETIPGKACTAPIMRGSTPEKTSRTIADLAKILIRISEHPFTKLGSITPGPLAGTWDVGPLLCRDTIQVLSPPHHPGPFRTAAEKWVYRLDELIDAFRTRGTCSQYREQGILTFSWLRDAVAAYEPYKTVEETYLMHDDASGSHLMVDEEGNITGIIDWEWAATASKWEAFAAPFALLPHMSLMDASNTPSREEQELIDNFDTLGRPDVAPGNVWLHYPLIQGLADCLGVVVPADEEGFLQEQREKYGVDSDEF